MSEMQLEKGRKPKRTPKIAKYDVSKALKFILDTGNNRASRAIKLYEFFVAVHQCEGFPNTETVGKRKRQVGDPKGRFIIKVDSKSIGGARLFAAMKILEKESKTDRRAAWNLGSVVISLAKSDFRNAYLQFLKEDGWRGARYLPSTREFQSNLDAKQKEMRIVADLLEISLAVDPSRLGARQAGGIAHAMNVLSAEPKILRDTVPWMKRVTSSISETRLDRVWRRFHPVSVIIYLWFGAGLGWNLRLTGIKFTTRLLKAVDSLDDLYELIAKHAAVRESLSHRNYSQIPVLCPSAKVYTDLSPIVPAKLEEGFYDIFGSRGVPR